MKKEIANLLESNLPLVDFNSDFLFEELDSIQVATILLLLSDKYDINLTSSDATPANLRSLESLTEMVKRKIKP